MRRRLRNAALVLLANLLLFLGVLYFLTWRYRRSIPHRHLMIANMSDESGIPVEVLRSISWFHIDPRRDLRGLPKRRPGVVRIGCFGDSFTFGNEVDGPLSYPARLQELFRRDFDNVEVINFGSGGLSLGETLHLWEEFGSGFDLSFFIVGPMTVFPERESTFNHFFPEFPESMHGRYLLDGDSLRWLDPVHGDGDDGRIEEYQRFFPHWIYLRYDRRPPMFLQALIARGKSITNPFYYRSDSLEDEANLLLPRILQRLASAQPQLIFTQIDAERARYAAGLDAQMVINVVGDPGNPSLNRRIMGHLSGAGNDRIAHVLRDILLDRNPARTEALALAPVAERLHTRPLDEFAHGAIYLGEQLGATFLYQQRNTADWKDQPVDFHADQIRSLLFFGEGGVFGPGLALGRDRPFDDGAAIEGQLTCDGVARHARLGEVKVLDDSADLARALAPSLQASLTWRAELDLSPAPEWGSHCRGTISVGGEPLFSVEQSSWGLNELVPLHGQLVVTKPAPDTWLDVERLPPTGPWRLELDGPGHLDVTAGSFTKTTLDVAWNRNGLHRYIRASGRRAEVLPQGESSPGGRSTPSNSQ